MSKNISGFSWPTQAKTAKKLEKKGSLWDENG
jgi:hypothetical protein